MSYHADRDPRGEAADRAFDLQRDLEREERASDNGLSEGTGKAVRDKRERVAPAALRPSNESVPLAESDQRELELALRFYAEGHFDHGKRARETLREVHGS